MNKLAREKDPNILPKATYFKQLASDGSLISPGESARFIINVLLKTENNEFTNTDWKYKQHGASQG